MDVQKVQEIPYVLNVCADSEFKLRNVLAPHNSELYATAPKSDMASEVRADPTEQTQYPNIAQRCDPANTNLYAYHYRTAKTTPNG